MHCLTFFSSAGIHVACDLALDGLRLFSGFAVGGEGREMVRLKELAHIA